MRTQDLDLTNRRFGRLFVIDIYRPTKNGQRRWVCVCDCNNVAATTTARLLNGDCRSCGCLRMGLPKSHGHTVNGMISKTYKSWALMLARCYNKKNNRYYRYGGRGITVCDRWKDSFENFLADMGNRPKDCSLDRIRNDVGYCKENCRWATKLEQARNKTNARMIAYRGEIRALWDWAQTLNLNYDMLHARLMRGWRPERMFEQPLRRCGRS
jgi:hypothetical protein